MKYALLPGESALENAPSARLSNGQECIPQHYLVFNHNTYTVKNILSDITYHDRYPLFVCEDCSGLYLQVGIIGEDNYQTDAIHRNKIVYGRKWRIEPQLPTSEIIQTAFLALQKAREHEVRELFRLEEQGFTCTPFNNHHDLPLMAQHQKLLQRPTNHNSIDDFADAIKNALAKIHYDHSRFEFLSLTSLRENLWLVDIKLHVSEKTILQELIEKPKLSFLLHQPDSNHLYHQLMDTCLKLSNQHVEENFSYKDFCRFNRDHNIEAIASLSVNLRNQHQDIEFSTKFKKSNYDTDLTRAPVLDDSSYSDRLREQFKKYSPLAGILPIDKV